MINCIKNNNISILCNNKHVMQKIGNSVDLVIDEEVPYISLYYIDPIVSPNEDVYIRFYITDYFYKDYIKDYYRETFTITVKIENRHDIVIPNLKAGDHSVNLGSFSDVGEKKFSIYCTDRYGRNSHEIFTYFLVDNPINYNEYVMTSNDLATYNIKNNDNYEEKYIVDLSYMTTPTAASIKTALDDASNGITPNINGYTCIIPGVLGNGQQGTWYIGNDAQRSTPSLYLKSIVKYGSNYNKANILNESINTRTGLQQLIDDKKSQGYNKIRLLQGVYRVDHQSPIYIPDNFTLDMNGATFKLNQFAGDTSMMVSINHVSHSHVINGTIEGDYYSHDYIGSPNDPEWVNGVTIEGESKYCTFENMIIKDIVGYGSTNKIAISRDGTKGYTHDKSVGIPISTPFVLGDIDRNTGELVESTKRTVSGFTDIKDHALVGYLSVNRYLGYQGVSGECWNVICHFYDVDKNYIKSIDAYQYRRVGVPPNAKFIRVTILKESYPTDLKVVLFKTPYHCAYINVKHDNCRCVGLAPQAMNNMLFKNCEFTKCGQAQVKCALDAEDGWDMMQDSTFQGLRFYNNVQNDMLTFAGHNLIIDNQISGKIHLKERTKSPIIKNCTNVSFETDLPSGGNIVRHGVWRIYDNAFISADFKDNATKNNSSTTYLKGNVRNSTMNAMANDSIYDNCIFNVKSKLIGDLLKNIQVSNSEFTPVSGFTDRYEISMNTNTSTSNVAFDNCKFNGKTTLESNFRFYSGSFKKCAFEDTYIKPDVRNDVSDKFILFEDCNINYSSAYLIYCMPTPDSVSTMSNMIFNNCKITNTANSSTAFIFAYAKPNGYCNFTNCTISIPLSTKILDGYILNASYMTNYTLNFNNTDFINDNDFIVGSLFDGKVNILVT